MSTEKSTFPVVYTYEILPEESEVKEIEIVLDENGIKSRMKISNSETIEFNPELDRQHKLFYKKYLRYARILEDMEYFEYGMDDPLGSYIDAKIKNDIDVIIDLVETWFEERTKIKSEHFHVTFKLLG